jgi:hypothetical protein
LRSCQNNSKELYEAQIRNLKEMVDQKDHEIENTKSLEKLEKNRLADHIRALEKEMAHVKNAHVLELKGLKHHFEIDFESEKKRLESEKSL